jgi:hypothetical protein
MTETTFRTMTIEHLGQDATDADLVAFRAACFAVLPAFEYDEEAATWYVWNDGDIRWAANEAMALADMAAIEGPADD